MEIEMRNDIQPDGQNEAYDALTRITDLANRFDREILEMKEECLQARAQLEEIEAEKEAGRRESGEQYQEIMKLTVEKITRGSWLQRREEHADWQQAFLDRLEGALNHIIGGSHYELWAMNYVETFVDTWDHLRDDNVKKALARLNERVRELRIELTRCSHEFDEKKKFYQLKKQEEERARLAEEKKRQEEEERLQKLEEERIMNEKRRQKEELIKQVQQAESTPVRTNPFRTISFDPNVPHSAPSFDQLRATIPSFGFSSKSYWSSSSTSSINESTELKEVKSTPKPSAFPTFSQLGRF